MFTEFLNHYCVQVEDEVNSSIKKVFDEYNGVNSNAQSRAIDYVQRQVKIQLALCSFCWQSLRISILFIPTASVLWHPQLLGLAVHTLVWRIQKQQRAHQLLQIQCGKLHWVPHSSWRSLSRGKMTHNFNKQGGIVIKGVCNIVCVCVMQGCEALVVKKLREIMMYVIWAALMFAAIQVGIMGKYVSVCMWLAFQRTCDFTL